MKRTTIRLEDRLFHELKQYAADTQQTVTSVIEDAVREVLSRRQQAPRQKPVRLKTVGGKGLQPGVDLDDTRGLLDRMEERG